MRYVQTVGAGGVAAAFTRRHVEATATELGSLKSAYCNLTISKQTFSVSEPATTGKWLRSYFPVECESDGGFTDYSLCEHSMGGCGSLLVLLLLQFLELLLRHLLWVGSFLGRSGCSGRLLVEGRN